MGAHVLNLGVTNVPCQNHNESVVDLTGRGIGLDVGQGWDAVAYHPLPLALGLVPGYEPKLPTPLADSHPPDSRIPTRVGSWRLSGIRSTLTGKRPTEECVLDGARPDQRKAGGPVSNTTVSDLTPGAVALWVKAFAYSSVHETSGFIPAAAVSFLQGQDTDAVELSRNDWWRPVNGGWKLP